jgi:hypothetical protein
MKEHIKKGNALALLLLPSEIDDVGLELCAVCDSSELP